MPQALAEGEAARVGDRVRREHQTADGRVVLERLRDRARAVGAEAAAGEGERLERLRMERALGDRARACVAEAVAVEDERLERRRQPAARSPAQRLSDGLGAVEAQLIGREVEADEHRHELLHSDERGGAVAAQLAAQVEIVPAEDGETAGEG